MSAPSLHDLQRGFWRSIAGCRAAFDPALIEFVEAGTGLSADNRIGVYADAYFLRLRGVLAEDFPTVAKVLGHERFDSLARDYLRAFPSVHPSVRHFGRSMAVFIED